MSILRKKQSKAEEKKLNFVKYQKQVVSTDDSKKFLVSLLGLVGEIGDIETVVKRRLELGRYPNFEKDMAEEIGDTLWYLASLSSRLGLSLQKIAYDNIQKAKHFHAPGTKTDFDRGYPKDERFPRQFEVVFEEKSVGKGINVKIIKNGVFIGDALTDNAHGDDGYRYHDAFHLAYAAILGWSPVVRALLRRKRKSNLKTDEIEDGARAIVVEEAIALFIFNQAQIKNEFREESSIDISLLKTVRRLCGKLEVGRCTAKQWRAAIFNGYEVFRLLRDNHGGTVILDLDKASISFKPHGARSKKGVKSVGNSRGRLPKRMAARGSTDRGKSRRVI